MMSYILLAIKDYCKDWWHDYLVAKLKKFGCAIYDYIPAKPTALVTVGYLEPAKTWKKGNLWDYIRQRKATKLLKDIKQLKQQLEQEKQR